MSDNKSKISDIVAIGSLIISTASLILWHPGLYCLDRFRNMFVALNAKLPYLTQVVLCVGDPLYSILYYCAAVFSITMGVYGYVKSGLLISIVAICVSVFQFSLIKVYQMAIFTPINELQKQLN